MDIDNLINHLDQSKKSNALANRHINQLRSIKYAENKTPDIEFGLMRLIQTHESFVYMLYEKLFHSSKSDLHGYKLVCNTYLVYEETKLEGNILALGPDKALDSFRENEMLLKNAGGTCEFFDSLIYTPVPFVFVPYSNLYDTADFIGRIFGTRKESSSTCRGCAGNSQFVILEPLTLYNIGLGFLCQQLITENNISSFVYGFVY